MHQPRALVTSYHVVARLSAHYQCANTALLFLALERWHSWKNKAFFKFQAPCDHPLYRPGDSWQEELGFTANICRSAFQGVGIHYKSKTAFLTACEAGDPFNGLPFLSYTDRGRRLTYYVRNHAVADAIWQQIGQPAPQAEQESETPRAAESALPEIQKTDVFKPNIKTTKKNTSINNSQGKEPEKTGQTAYLGPLAAPITNQTSQPARNVPTEGPKPPTVAEVAQCMTEAHGLAPASAQAQAERFLAYYTRTGWASANGFRVTDWRASVRHWQVRQGAEVRRSKTERGLAASPPPRPDTPPKAKLPTEWNPALYAKLSYLQQLDYMRQLEALGWQKVRPPQGTPAVIDRWYVPPGTVIEAV